MLTLIKSIYDIQETFHLPIVSPYFFFLPPFHIITFFNTHSLVSPYTTAHGFPFNTLHIYKRQNSFIFFKTPSLFLNFLLLFLTHFSPARKSSNTNKHINYTTPKPQTHNINNINFLKNSDVNEGEYLNIDFFKTYVNKLILFTKMSPHLC